MPQPKGKIVLMGSGELTATMVEVHKHLLSGLAVDARAVFLDTPAGFQLNVDQISQKAVDYFDTRVKHPMTVASFKSQQAAGTYDGEAAFHQLREAGYILIGPGSPTYTVRQIKDTAIPEIFVQRVRQGGCLVAASAAALTVGRFTLPVYEIYKVGDELHWVDGLDILGQFGLNLVVIPHWNNAEGGTHDTSCCFMGRSRFSELAGMLPDDVAILGIDEHTACIIDFDRSLIEVKGIGRVVWQRGQEDAVFKKGDRFQLDRLQEGRMHSENRRPAPRTEHTPPAAEDDLEGSLWERIHAIEKTVGEALERKEAEAVTGALLELDRIIWQAHEGLESEEFVAQAREILRDQLVLLGTKLDSVPGSENECIMPVVEAMIELRQQFRENKQWGEADAIRDSLERSNVLLEDTPEGTRWQLKS